MNDGWTLTDGASEGFPLGLTDGNLVGPGVGATDGSLVGTPEGSSGPRVGAPGVIALVGAGVGSGHRVRTGISPPVPGPPGKLTSPDEGGIAFLKLKGDWGINDAGAKTTSKLYDSGAAVAGLKWSTLPPGPTSGLGSGRLVEIVIGDEVGGQSSRTAIHLG